MNHLMEDELLLLAYDELPADRAVEVASHVAGCAVCQRRLDQLDRGRVALELLHPVHRRTVVGAVLALATAAMLAGVAIGRSTPVREQVEHWTPTTTWSATAGYITGGKTMRDIDAQLTRLEQEQRYGLPN